MVSVRCSGSLRQDKSSVPSGHIIKKRVFPTRLFLSLPSIRLIDPDYGNHATCFVVVALIQGLNQSYCFEGPRSGVGILNFHCVMAGASRLPRVRLLGSGQLQISDGIALKKLYSQFD